MATSSSTTSPASLRSPASVREALERVAGNLSEVLLGKSVEARLAVTCLVARGHLLLEDVPGVGKTTLAEALGRSFGLSFGRIQFTSDLLPADMTGVQVFRPQTGDFEFRPGPLFHQLVLADELNRAPPRTQSALLEAMAQRQVSIDGRPLPLPQPFTVVATQNPLDLAGTYPLPESQLDRFLMRLSLGHPPRALETRLLMSRQGELRADDVPTVSSPEELLSLWQHCSETRLDDKIAEYIVRIGEETRKAPDLERGASTRATLALASAAKAQALWESRTFVTPGDVRTVVGPVLAHRMIRRSSVGGTYSRDEMLHRVQEIVRQVPEPR